MPLQPLRIARHASKLAAAVETAAERNAGPREAVAQAAPFQDANLADGLLRCDNVSASRAPQDQEITGLRLRRDARIDAMSAKAGRECAAPKIGRAHV